MQIKGKRNQSLPFATRVEGLLSQIRDKYPEKLTHPEEQRLLKDHLFHGCKKSIQDNVKYCFEDPHMDYMQFLEECRKAEDEDKVDKLSKPTKSQGGSSHSTTHQEDELNK